MTTYLDKILYEKRLLIDQKKCEISLTELMRDIQTLPAGRNLQVALQEKNISIIAEIKFRSPSKGSLHLPVAPKQIAMEYEKSGVAAISVLTDSLFFGGENEHLIQIKKNVSIPVLRKDFIIDPWQIYESKRIGADAILLIAAVLEKNELSEYLHIASSLGLSVLVEVHSKAEVHSAIEAGADIIGINNRNLHTFKTDIETSRSLQKYIPKNKIIISESGICSHKDIQALLSDGINCFLIGESILTAPDKGLKIQELLGGAL